MKDHCIELLQYDHWATMKLLTHVQDLPEDLFHKPTESVFSSIAETLFHIYRGQRIWMKRCFPHLMIDESVNEFKDIEVAENHIIELHQMMIQSIHDYYDELDEIVYQNDKGTPFKNSLKEILIHLANHGTYHRGNIASMIRQFGCKGTSTDYIQYLRDLS